MFIGPDHDRQGAVFGPNGAARNRGVNPAAAGIFDRLGKAPRGFDCGGAHIDNNGAFFDAVNNAVFAKKHVFKGIGIGNTDDDDVRIGSGIGRGARGGNALILKRVEGFGVAGVDCQDRTGFFKV